MKQTRPQARGELRAELAEELDAAQGTKGDTEAWTPWRAAQLVLTDARRRRPLLLAREVQEACSVLLTPTSGLHPRVQEHLARHVHTQWGERALQGVSAQVVVGALGSGALGLTGAALEVAETLLADGYQGTAPQLVRGAALLAEEGR